MNWKAKEKIIDGITLKYRDYDGWIFWTSAWEKIHDLVKKGYVRREDIPHCWNHTSFYLI